MVIRPLGDRALLIDVAPDLANREALRAVLRVRLRLSATRIAGVRELVPAARTVLVTFDPSRVRMSAVSAWIEREAAAAADVGTEASRDIRSGDGVPDVSADAKLPESGVREPEVLAREVRVDIRYDGPDVAETAALLGLSVEALVAAHSSATWTVAFTGFAPGFGYLVSDDWQFDVPRLASPRTRVPAGAVGVAAGFSGAYPRATPGGWRLIGSTSAPLFDPDASSPALLRPGMTVRFDPSLPTTIPLPATVPGAGGGPRVGGGGGIRVEAVGGLASVQDQGRADAASVGVSRSGALDRGALRTANRLVGNDEHHAGIEITMGGFRATAGEDLWIAVTGAWGPITIGERPVDHGVAHLWRAGAELAVGWFTAGARGYLAVRGGIDAPEVLRSRSTDTLSGLGPPPLRAGAALAVGPEPRIDVPAHDLAPWGPPPRVAEVRVVPGPRADLFAPETLDALFLAEWTVSSAADRVGMRLAGTPLNRMTDAELPSEGMVPGAIQVPPSGAPTILLADGPVTGGYPVIATVIDADLDALGQASTGTRISFRHARPL